jgi:molybdopterin synthase catalytic subunit
MPDAVIMNGGSMELSTVLAELKLEPGFTDNVGMVLIHNGVVRSWSRSDRRPVRRIRVTPDREKMELLRKEFQSRPGIFRVIVHAFDGELAPGDDLLYLIVAGDIRENVKPVLSDLLDRIKAEAVIKEEIF